VKININGTTHKVFWHHNIGKYFGFNGSTICKIINKDTNEQVAIGESFCSDKDSYNKKVGRKFSLTKAISKFDKSVRASIWDQFKTQIGV